MHVRDLEVVLRLHKVHDIVERVVLVQLTYQLLVELPLPLRDLGRALVPRSARDELGAMHVGVRRSHGQRERKREQVPWPAEELGDQTEEVGVELAVEKNTLTIHQKGGHQGPAATALPGHGCGCGRGGLFVVHDALLQRGHKCVG